MIKIGISSRTPYCSIIVDNQSKKTSRFREFPFDQWAVEESMDPGGVAKPGDGCGLCGAD